MTKLDKLRELRNIQAELKEIRNSDTASCYPDDNKIGLQVRLSSGKSAFIEFDPMPGLLSCNVDPSIAQHRQNRSLETWLAGMVVPELRDEFERAIDKLASKTSRILEAARRVANAPNIETKEISRLREVYAGNPLFERECRTQRRERLLGERELELARELRLARSTGVGNHLWEAPDEFAVERAYHLEEKASKAKPSDP